MPMIPPVAITRMEAALRLCAAPLAGGRHPLSHAVSLSRARWPAGLAVGEVGFEPERRTCGFGVRLGG